MDIDFSKIEQRLREIYITDSANTDKQGVENFTNVIAELTIRVSVSTLRLYHEQVNAQKNPLDQ
jgi:hypothetical protein